MPPSDEEMMMELNDELLSAYLDEALDADTRTRVEERAWMPTRVRGCGWRTCGRRTRRCATRMPPRGGDRFESLLKEQRGGAVDAAPPRGSRLVPWAVAASLAGLIAGYLLPRMDAGEGPRCWIARWCVQLDTQRSGAPVAEGTQVLLTFQAADGRYCRLFRAGRCGCRWARGWRAGMRRAWKLTAWDASAPESVDGFRTAGASALVDGAMAALGGKPAMSGGEEDAAIWGWSRRRRLSDQERGRIAMRNIMGIGQLAFLFWA